MDVKKAAHSFSYKKEFTPKFWTCLKNHYTLSLFKHDLLAGLTVGIVALPLAMAFAIASGLPPIYGIYTGIVAGFLISLFGGSYSLIGGPTGAFVVIIYGIVQRHGYDGLVIATLLAGILLLVSAVARIGSLIKYIPYPLVIGFTSGIAVLIFSSQIKDFFGLRVQNLPADFIPKCIALFSAFPTFDPMTFAIAFGTLTLIILIKRYFPSIPWGITAIAIASFVTFIFKIPVETIATKFGEIPRTPPSFQLPNFFLPFSKWKSLIPDAITIAFLAGIESLLAAVVADGMTGRRHKPNCELLGQGLSNIASVLFGGLPATGAIARTATSIKSGAKTPVAGMIHALTLALILLLFSKVVSQIPLACLSAVLMVVAYNMSEIHHFRHLFKAPRYDVVILLTTFLLTVFLDLTIAVGVGMILSAFFFLKRVSDISRITPLFFSSAQEESAENYDEKIETITIPNGVEIYEITGPFFFGLADSLKDLLQMSKAKPKVFILRMRMVPTIDASGMHALMDFEEKCRKDNTTLILSGVRKSVLKTLRKFDITKTIKEEFIFSHIDLALRKAETLIQEEKN